MTKLQAIKRLATLLLKVVQNVAWRFPTKQKGSPHFKEFINKYLISEANKAQQVRNMMQSKYYLQTHNHRFNRFTVLATSITSPDWYVDTVLTRSSTPQTVPDT